MKKGLGIFCAALALVLLCAGCTTGTSGTGTQYTDDGKTVVRVSMYNSSSYPLWRAYVEEHCPDVSIVWENNRNTVSNVLYQAKHDDMPDIVAIRRFESDTTSQLKPYLADLSDLPVTSTYKSDYLVQFADDGKQYWLPEPGAFDGTVANADLFTQYGIALPTDQSSMAAACRQLRQHNVQPLAYDAKESWTPATVMEGMAVVTATGSETEAAWRSAIEDGSAGATDSAWLSRVADSLRTLRDNGVLTQESLNYDAAATHSMLLSGQAAMVRKNSDELFDSTNSHKYTALPSFAQSSDNNQLLTYPVFSLALSKEAASDETREKAAKEVLSVMLDEGAQQILNQNGEGLISYNQDIHLTLSSSMQNLQPLIDRNQYFIRVLNSNTFKTTTLGLTALLRDNADNTAFVDLISQNLFKVQEPTNIAVSNLSAPNTMDTNLCSQSASVIAQVLTSQTGADCTVIDVKESPTDIYKGTYTDVDLNAVVPDDKMYAGTLTGSELTRLMDAGILYATTFRPGQIEPLVEYPAVAGMTVSMQQDGTIQGITMADGKAPADGQTYRVALSANIYSALKIMNNGLADKFQVQDKTMAAMFSDGFASAGNLPQPQEYYEVQP
jgi:hypothetical protein